MGIDIYKFAMNMINNNPEVKNNPKAQAMINAIANRDASAGIEIANNLCKTYGTNPEEAIQNGLQWFGIGGTQNAHN